eukprot:CAMPEP_0202906016 /NCGR_PEP_ID=MMETSP1392-20130828/37031_1 /ASSEMBLY_ACC=CAM_ASM_000868 /TAXON_ID=225041 /ORGANISM="Chlamydomonas chlamydogama, Strain SAG 11-48b" /LENGTH=1079 /DNA_ID=CAMNT_0049594355 /DNA_START=194 /DNA_END=3430 /DNA_ORIENTATION=-
MGCASSRDSVGGEDGKKDFHDLSIDNASQGLSVYLPTSGPLTAKDYKSRLASSEGTQTLYFPQHGFTLRYAFVSQRGYYPDSPDKANQDSLCIHPHFGGDGEQALFCVFDGHGEYGTQCSQFARDKVPENLLNNAQLAVSPEIAYHRAMVLTNNQLHRVPDVDDSMSGTTAIAALVRGRHVYVANVGDSRCVMAERSGDKLIAQDLSFDQTPFRRDECERVKRCGARVLTLDQLEGLKDPNVEHWGTEEENDGDPPRLWAPNATYPGTAFTRSIGDSAAERIGVFAEPEVVAKQLTSANPFIVLASDGVWEFLPSQSVVDMVSKFDDPQEACFSVVAESYRLWLQHETRTDDITMLVVQFQGLEDEAPQMALPTPLGAMLDYSTRPAATGLALKRLQTSRQAIEMPSVHTSFSAGTELDHSGLSFNLANRGATGNLSFALNSQNVLAQAGVSMSGTSATSASGAHGPAPGRTRTPEELQSLEEAVWNNFLFSNLPEAQRLEVFEAFEKRIVKAGEVIIRQGDPGDHFYIVEAGQFDVYLQHLGSVRPELVHTYLSQPGQKASFGELALLYSKPRAATVIARTDGMLWSLHRAAFKGVLQRQYGLAAGGKLGENDTRAVVRTLRSVEVLQCLSMSHLHQLAEAMSEVVFNDGEYVIRQGEEGRDFFLIISGEVVCTVRKNPADQSEAPKEVLRLTAGQYFGERALLTNAKRAANVLAAGQVSLLAISRQRFEQLLGPLQDIIDAEVVWKDQLALQREVLARKNLTSAKVIQGNFSLDDLVARGLLFSTDCSAMMLMEHKQSEEIFTVRVTSVADVVSMSKQGLVLRAREITRSMEPSFFVPGVLKSFKDSRVLAEVLMTVGLCTLDMLLHPNPFDEMSAVFVAASVILGLEHLHWSQVIYRGLSVHSVIVTEGGQVQLVDFRFARKNEGRAHTLCGNPEYLAPEVVEGRGHTEAVDLWSLGVLIYCLLSGETPFAAPGDDELRIYRKITLRSLQVPPYFSPAAADLIDKLLQKEPAARLGAGPLGMQGLKSHPWFQAINWDALLEHRYPPPPGIRERIYNFEGVAYANFDPKPYEGDTNW